MARIRNLELRSYETCSTAVYVSDNGQEFDIRWYEIYDSCTHYRRSELMSVCRMGKEISQDNLRLEEDSSRYRRPAVGAQALVKSKRRLLEAADGS